MSNIQETLYSYKVAFTLGQPSSFDDFWSFVIFRLNIEQSEYTYDRFARLYNTLCAYSQPITQEYPVGLTLEESAKKYHIDITTDCQNFLSELTQKLDAFAFTYEHTKNSLRYSIDKKEPKSEVKLQESSGTVNKYNYNFIEETDLEEMLNILEKIHIKNYKDAYETFHIDELNDYRTTFSYYSSYLKYYPELNHVNNIIAELSVVLSLYPNEALALANDFRILLESFIQNILHWQDKIFFKRTEKIDFMDNSLKADLAQIKVVLNVYDELQSDEDENSLDDIFDF